MPLLPQCTARMSLGQDGVGVGVRWLGTMLRGSGSWVGRLDVQRNCSQALKVVSELRGETVNPNCSSRARERPRRWPGLVGHLQAG